MALTPRPDLSNMKDMSEQVRIAALADIPPGSSHELIAGGRVIALYNVEGTLYALDGVCPHAGGPLGKGQLDGCTVTCPWHGWQFDASTGQHCLTEAIRQPSFPVTIDGDDVLVDLP